MNKHVRPSTVLTILLLALFCTIACKQDKSQLQTPNSEWITGSNIVYFSNFSTTSNPFSELLNAIPELQRSGVRIVHIAIPDEGELPTEKPENSLKQLRILADSLHRNNIKLMTDLPVKACSSDGIERMIAETDADGFYIPEAETSLNYEWNRLQDIADSLKSGFFFATRKRPTTAQSALTISTQDEYPELITRIGTKQLKASALISVFEKEAKALRQNDIRIYTAPFPESNEHSQDRSSQMITIAFIYTLPGIVELSERYLTNPQTDSTFIHLIRNMNRLKSGNKGLWSMKYNDSFMGLRNTAPDAIVSYVRFYKKTQVLCIFNFSHEKQTFRITDMLNGSFSVYSGENINAVYNKDITLPPMSYTVQTCMN